MKTALEWLKLVAALLAAILIGEIPEVKAASLAIDAQRPWLLPALLALLAFGFLLLIWGAALVAVRHGKPTSHEEVEQLTAGTQVPAPGRVFAKARIRGKTTGVKVDPPTGWTLKEMKDAWRDGRWWRDPEMRSKYLVTTGGIMAVLAGFAAGVVLFQPASVKLIVVAALLYAIVRLAHAFRRA